MPALTEISGHAMLNALHVAQISLHSFYSTTGANEIFGGGYTRLAFSFGSPLHNSISGSGTFVFNVGAGTTVAWVGMWDGAGNFLGMMPFGGNINFGARGALVQQVMLHPTSPSTLIVPFTDLATDEKVVFWYGPNLVYPATDNFVDLAEGIIYTVLSHTLHTIQLARLSTAPPLSFSRMGGGYVQRINPLFFANQDHVILGAIGIDNTVGTANAFQ